MICVISLGTYLVRITGSKQRDFSFSEVEAGTSVPSHLLDALAAQRRQAGGFQLVGVAADPQLPVAVAAPAVHLRGGE